MAKEKVLMMLQKIVKRSNPSESAGVEYVRAVEDYKNGYHSNSMRAKQNIAISFLDVCRSANGGDIVAQTVLGVVYDNGLHHVAQDYKEAEKWYRLAAEQGFVYAQNNLGQLYGQGLGVPQNYTVAVEWYRRAVKQGYANAQYNLGFMYANGHGVKQDYTEAAEWYRYAAKQDHAKAQYSLAMAHKNGHGVMQNNVKAYMWFNLAAAQGDEEARKVRDELNNKMTPEKIAEGQELALQCLAANYQGY
jgi:TPR repeat protein